MGVPHFSDARGCLAEHRFFVFLADGLILRNGASAIQLIASINMITRYLLQQEISELFSTEAQLTQILPLVAESAYNGILRRKLREHVSRARRQSNYLPILGRSESLEIKRIACVSTQALLYDLHEIVEAQPTSVLRDLMLSNKLRMIKAYEVISYRIAGHHAAALGNTLLSEQLALLRMKEEDIEYQLTYIVVNSLNEGFSQMRQAG